MNDAIREEYPNGIDLDGDGSNVLRFDPAWLDTK